MESEIEADQKLRWRDLAKEYMARNQMPTEMAEDWKHRHVMIQAGTLRSVDAKRWEGEKKYASNEYEYWIMYKYIYLEVLG